MLDVRDLTVSLGPRRRRRQILSGVSLTLPAGQVLAVCGPNGAGKSTLLRAILGEVPAAGGIGLNGIDPRAASPRVLADLRAVLPQDTQVAFRFTAGEIVAMGLAAAGRPATEATLGQALAAVGLAGMQGRAFHDLSGGERQRVHLARALAQVWEPSGPQGPRWLFLDEPVTGLDLGHQLLAMRLAQSFARRGGGVVAVLHDLNIAAMFADRVALVAGGGLAAIGPPETVLTDALLARAFGCRVAMNRAPSRGVWFLPQCCEVI
jgi:iron complex transport system ATP-binding protein